MIGVDSNLLLRWLLDDDPAQTAAAAAALQAGETVHLCDIVLAEVAWVLNRTYRLPRPAVARALRRVLGSAAVAVSHPAAVDAALTAYETGGPGLADHLIAHLNRAAGCRTTLTFDKEAGGASAFTLLP